MTDGLIILDKPASMSSARAVDAVKRLLPRGTKVGHAGTLDPFATGVLVLLVGRATKRCERVMSWLKTYETTMRLGATTETDDPETPERPFRENAAPETVPRAQIEEALKDFVGRISQRPPLYSAIKMEGKRACDRARAGQQQIELEPREVQVYGIEVLDYDWPLLRLRIECGRGTYIRSIARDLGERLGVGGYLTALRRTRIGRCDLRQAVRLEQLTSQNILAHIRPIDEFS